MPDKSYKKRIAIINQRYGKEINGGSEYFTRQLAQHLSFDYKIQILTTCAKNYTTWKNEYPKGNCLVDGIEVIRFPVTKMRNPRKFRWIDRMVRYSPIKKKQLQQYWIKEQGPYCPDLIEYIKAHKKTYDLFIFVTYLYYPTAMGLPMVSEKSILIPTAHEEPYIQFEIYQKIFQIPKAIIYLTQEEKDYVQTIFHNSNIKNQIIGMGISVPEKKRIQNKHNPYLIYAGRIDLGKNCKELFDYFLEYQKHTSKKLSLLLIGTRYISIPNNSWIQYLGFVSEEKKYELISGAVALCLPSKYESFSIAVLEAMALETPVLVNGACNVLKGHCKKSKAGYCYYDKKSFQNGVEHLLDKAINSEMGRNGKVYIKENYQWDFIIKSYQDMIEL